MNNNQYYVTAELKLTDMTRLEEMKTALTTLQQATIKEAGCHLFSVHQDKSDPSKIILWECFEDEEAFEHHFTLQHTKDYFALNITEVVQAVKSDLMIHSLN